MPNPSLIRGKKGTPEYAAFQLRLFRDSLLYMKRVLWRGCSLQGMSIESYNQISKILYEIDRLNKMLKTPAGKEN